MTAGGYNVLAVGLCSVLLYNSILAAVEDDTKCLCTSCEAFLQESDSSYLIYCLYPENLNTTESDFNVQRYPLDHMDNGTVPVHIVQCNWDDQSNLKCEVMLGYNISGEVSNRVMVHIPNPTQEHEGEYVCIAVGDKYRAVPCRLTLTGLPGIPSGIQIVNATMNTLTVKWAPGSRGKLNLTQYFRIRYKKENKTEIPPLFYTYQNVPLPDATNFTVHGLEPDTVYEVSVMAFNGVGESKFYERDAKKRTQKNEDEQKYTAGLNDGEFVGIGIAVGLFVGAILGAVIYHILVYRNRADPAKICRSGQAELQHQQEHMSELERMN